MKSNTIWWVIAIITIIGIIYWLYTKNKLAKLGIVKIVSSSGEETDCNRENVRSEVCPPPATDSLYLVMSDVKERAWTEKELGFHPDPEGTATRSENIRVRFRTGNREETWYYNQRRYGNNPKSPYYDPKFPVTEDKFYFVNSTKYPNCNNPNDPC